MTQKQIEKDLMDKAKQETKHIEDRKEQIKQLLPKYINNLTAIKILCNGNCPKTTIAAINELKFEFLSNQKLDTPNNIKQKNIENYLDWLKELNQNDNNANLIINILMK